VRHVIFRVGTELYGLPIASVREVIEPGPVSRVPRSPPLVRGIMNVRGRVVTVVDLGLLLAVAPPPSEPAGAPKIVILDRGRRDLGLRVSAVPGIHEVDEPTAAPGTASPAIRGLAQSQLGAVTLLDPDGVEQQIAHALRPRGGLLG